MSETVLINVCPVCKFVLTKIDYRKQQNLSDTLFTTDITCHSCGAILRNEMLVLQKPQGEVIINERKGE